jgi:hypothetical protein
MYSEPLGRVRKKCTNKKKEYLFLEPQYMGSGKCEAFLTRAQADERHFGSKYYLVL